jgi:hypothetical protein
MCPDRGGREVVQSSRRAPERPRIEVVGIEAQTVKGYAIRPSDVSNWRGYESDHRDRGRHVREEGNWRSGEVSIDGQVFFGV